MEALIQIFGAYIAIIGFSLIQGIPKRLSYYAGILGATGWAVYLFVQALDPGVLAKNFWAAAAISVCSHILARKFKTPVTVFIISGILTLVPGAGMYRIVYYMVQGQSDMTSYYIGETLQVAGIIAVAVFVVNIFVQILVKAKIRSMKRK